ncbi:MAG: hypothetical protein V9E81_09090 [Marmoricola sp.]
MFDPSVGAEEFEASSNGFWAVGQHALIEEWATKYVDATVALSSHRRSGTHQQGQLASAAAAHVDGHDGEIAELS